MQKLRTERGITLIALIITIIVMLILVGVTVSVSLNGGLFTTAQQAKNKTQLEIDKEQLLELALGAINNKGKVDLEKLDQAVLADERFTGEDGTYTSVKSGKTYTVNDWGGVTEAPELSGKWMFKNNLEPEMSTIGGEYLSQTISFTALGVVEYTNDETGWTELEPVTHSRITVSYECPWEEPLEYYIHVYCGSGMYYEGAIGFWEINGGTLFEDPLVDFGSEPQPVSQEFYDWFIANANPVEE